MVERKKLGATLLVYFFCPTKPTNLLQYENFFFKAGVDRSHFFLQQSLFSVRAYLIDVIWHKIKPEKGKSE